MAHLDKELLVTADTGGERRNEPVTLGIPLARGELSLPAELVIMAEDGSRQPVQHKALTRWPDDSVKWLLLDFCAAVGAKGCSSYRLISAPGRSVQRIPTALRVLPGADHWLVETGRAVFTIDAQLFRPFIQVAVDNKESLSPGKAGCCLAAQGSNSVPLIEEIRIEQCGPLRVTLRINGTFRSHLPIRPRFSCRLHFYANSSRVELAFTLHNPQPAHHTGGFWDLGDPGSFFFRELALTLPMQPGGCDTVSCTPEPGDAPAVYRAGEGPLCIYQASSGGRHWQSPLHRNLHGDLPLNRCGYQMRQQQRLLREGRRATPVVWCGSNSRGVAAALPYFWQEFPKALTVDTANIRLFLFPACFGDLYELQGGEQKATLIRLDFCASPDQLAWAADPLHTQAAPEVYRHSGVLQNLPSTETATDLLDLFLEGPEQLRDKRELIDEYGWRNFGDVYADHEAVYHTGSEPFISHYSNQYDLCAGLFRKGFASGNPLWSTLAEDLARHVLDIDLYHTDQDRDEYNHGLFWHTDHYLPAGLATHRSYSREQLQGRNPATGGGGPGAEHCYSTGLLLHYLTTGNETCREAVIALADWCLNSLNGSPTLLASCRRGWNSLKRSTGPDASARPFHRYPLSRGTGNSIIACLDAFEAGGGHRYLDHAADLISGSLHPDDRIDQRGLEMPEDSWSYTVLLVAVAAFIDKKAELGSFDQAFCHARDCLLAYGSWMAQHEYPYLERPELLEYPNETWPAQDLRKCVVLYHAARYSQGAHQQILLEKARLLYQTAKEQLQQHPTSSFTRPLALMLQNGWVGTVLNAPLPLQPAAAQQPRVSIATTAPVLSPSALFFRIGGDIAAALRRFSPAAELRWLCLRLGWQRLNLRP